MNHMDDYETHARRELLAWQAEMQREPGLFNVAAQRLQSKMNSYVPERIHEVVTAAVKQMIRAVLTGSQHTSQAPMLVGTLFEREKVVENKIAAYRRAAAAEGGITGAGGFFLGLADFPLLIGIKLKLLFEVAASYGHSTEALAERLYLLHVFQLAFSSQQHRRDVYGQMNGWQQRSRNLPSSIDEFDWRKFQQEYRDYIDLAKLAQLLPVIGAPVGMVVNNRLVRKLGITAIHAYRMRWFDEQDATQLKLAPLAAASN